MAIRLGTGFDSNATSMYLHLSRDDGVALAAIVKNKSSGRIDPGACAADQLIRSRFHHDDAEHSGAPVVVMDIPLLFETGGEKRVDAVVVVSTDPATQRERILARGTMTNGALDAILARQLPDAEKRKRADFVVDTSHGLDPVRAAIRDILAEVVKMPQRRT